MSLERINGVGRICDEYAETPWLDSLFGVIFKPVTEHDLPRSCSVHVERHLGDASESVVLLDAEHILLDPRVVLGWLA